MLKKFLVFAGLITVIALALTSFMIIFNKDQAGPWIYTPGLTYNDLFEEISQVSFIPSRYIADLTRKNFRTSEEKWIIPYPRYFTFGKGWGKQLKGGILYLKGKATILFNVKKRTEHTLYYECYLEKADLDRFKFTLKTYVNGTHIGMKHLLPGLNIQYFNVTRPILSEKENTIAFALERLKLETDADLKQERSKIIFKKIGFIENPADHNRSKFSVEQNLTRAIQFNNKFLIGREKAEKDLKIQKPGTLVVPLYIDGNAKFLRLSLKGVKNMGYPQSVRVILSSIDHDSKVICDYTERGTSIFFRKDRLSVTVPIEEKNRGTCMLIIELESDFFDGFVTLDKVELACLPHGEDPQTVKNAGAQKPEMRVQMKPRNIVLLILDAARPDHFGCYGYNKSVTPEIDRLSRSSTLFTQAFATAPYTLCSIPSMISGLPFAEHGVNYHNHTLNSEIKTLAEYCKELDYNTICFSASPNNSVAKNFSQGFDEFYEVWTMFYSYEEQRNPLQISNFFKKKLATMKKGQHFFHLLHFVPPHAPYDPPAEFDRFRNPEYSGNYDGSIETLRTINKEKQPPTHLDLEHITALYDGNLLLADYSAGLVFRTLKKKHLLKSTIIVVMSDHGEAFYEHGKMDHNTTLYDEMLKVPLLLKIPKNKAVIKDETMVSLLDIVPTMLNLVGSKPTYSLPGADIFNDNSPQYLLNNRFFVAQTAVKKHPWYSLRSSRWKAIIHGTRYQELYDTYADPMEKKNLVHEYPHIYAGLMELLSRHLYSSSSTGLKALDGDQPSDEDMSMLRELGYID